MKAILCRPTKRIKGTLMDKQTFKTIFDKETEHLSFDTKLAKRVKQFEDEFLNKNDDHVNFFSNPLCGVWPARFTKEDTNKWFDYVLDGTDDVEILAAIRKIPGIDESWKRATDPMNSACFYVAHRFLQSNLPKRTAEDAATSAIKIVHFKFVTSLMAHYFPFNADQSTAWATYNALSNKFALKVYGSWNKLFQARAEDIISNRSIHRKAMETFEKPKDIVYLISDAQVRVRDIVKNQSSKFYDVRANDASIIRTNNLVNINGDVVVRDMRRNNARYMSYMKSISQDEKRFIKDELVVVTTHAMHTMPVEPFKQTLQHITDVSGTPKGKDVDDLLKEIILHAIDFISKDRYVQSKVQDTTGLVQKLRQTYTASRSRDPSLLKMRKLGEKVVKANFKTRNQAHISSVRTGVFLYVVMRVFAMKHYG